MLNDDEIRFTGQRMRLVREIAKKGINDERVLHAIGKVPRHRFFKADLLQYAYQDMAFPIGCDQTISQPYTVAYQSELLCVAPGMKVLEIGTGSGYQAAVLCELGARVFSIERQQMLFNQTTGLLSRLGYKVRLIFGDGFDGYPEAAPFERILITAAAPEIPVKLLRQLSVGGKLVLPLGLGNSQIMTRITRHENNNFEMEKFGTFAFVPMLKGTNNE